jgi:DNA replication protein DnaC
MDIDKETKKMATSAKDAMEEILELCGESPTERPMCPKHGVSFEVLVDEQSDRTYLGCPDCERERADQLVAQELRALNGSCRIEPEFYHASIRNFETGGSLAKTKARDAVERLIMEKRGKVILAGLNGTGKTHLGCAAARALGGQIWSMYEISTRIRASYVSGAAETELQIVNELAWLPLLVIDEMGRTKGSKTEADWLSYIIDKRHSRGLPIIMITNKHLRRDCPKSGCDDCLERYMDKDVMSRMSQGGVFVKFDWGDRRREKR